MSASLPRPSITSADDKPLTYAGVSILESDGDKLTRFHAYFDPGKPGRQMAG